MANRSEPTTRFKVDISDLKKGIQEAQRQIRLANAQFKAAASGMDDWQKSSNGLTAKITQLKTVLTSQKTILSSLEQQYEKVAKEQGVNSKGAQELAIKIANQQAAVNKTEHSLNNYEGELKDVQKAELMAAKNGRSVEENLDDIRNSADDVNDELSESSDGFTVLKGVMANLATQGINIVVSGLSAMVSGLGKVAAASAECVNATAEMGDEIDKESQKLALSSDVFQELSYAMERSGSSIDDISLGMKTITNALADAENGVEGATDKFDALGISLQDANGDYKSAEDVLLEVIDALGKASNEAERNAIANDIFGRSYQEILPLLNSGADGIRSLMEEAKEYGMVMSEEAVKASAEYEDALTKLNGTIGGLKNNMVGAFLPSITEVINGFTDLAAGSDDAGAQIKKGLKNIVLNAKKMIPQAAAELRRIIPEVAEVIPEAASAVAEVLPVLITESASLLPVLLEDALPTIVGGITNVIVSNTPIIASAGFEFVRILGQSIVNSAPIWVDKIAETVDLYSKSFTENFDGLKDTFISIYRGLADSIIEILPMLKDQIPPLVKEVNTIFVEEFIPGFAELTKELASVVGLALAEMLPVITDFTLAMIKAIGDTAMANASTIREVGTSIINGIISGLRLALPVLVAMLPEITAAVITVVTQNLPLILDMGIKIVLAIAQGLLMALKDLTKTMGTLVLTILNKLGEIPSKAIEIGKNIVSGLWDGIVSQSEWLAGKVEDFCEGLVEKFEDAFEINSPSRVMRNAIGHFLPPGIAEGIEDKKDVVSKAIKRLANDAVADFNLDVNSAKAGLLAGSGAGYAAGTTNNTQNLTFNQYNTSPKALDRLTIYRDTNSLLFGAKVRLANV